MNTPEQGDRIELLVMPHDPAPQERGARGTVRSVTRWYGTVQIAVTWDNGRKLSLVCPPDRYRILKKGEEE